MLSLLDHSGFGDTRQICVIDPQFKISQLFRQFLRPTMVHTFNDKNWQTRMYCLIFVNSNNVHNAGTKLPLTKTAALECVLMSLTTACSALGHKEI